ncbi:type IV pilin protein [Crenobacter caeni]|uniref:Prepilin-type N-terminal cleavage/methylation domain-containing protein n=1 Tax=Crenobacter caeni TaxID=2705474 RepID=A0A6B2KSZ9_9NEIS|nr:type IV pilin protein [Crenobacter caeni]NDV13119.1 prepilin-type N-terminal cleavage/methylation domain-containing protein [Crenobacter caeni]
MKAGRQGGFSLIEVMIVVVVVGILASIAYPSYRQYLARGYRTEARVLMMELSQQAGQLYSARGDYTVFARCKDASCAAGERGGDALYMVQFEASGAHAYTIRATPTARFNRGWADDACAGTTLTLSQTGRRDVDGGSGDAATCWQR